MPETLHLLQLGSMPIWQQLQIEEALLRNDTHNWCIINSGSLPAIVMGVSGKTEELIHLDKIKHAPLPIIRRFSGGGTVIVDDNTLFVTFICNKQFVPIHPYPEPIMRWSEQIYQPVFGKLPFQLKDNDYVMGNKKFGGNAQSICKNRWLHHSSLLWDYSTKYMEYLRMPKKAPTYRQGRDHHEFLCSLREHWPEKSTFINALKTHLEGLFKVNTVRDDDLNIVQEALKKPHRKATTFVEI